MKRSKPNVAGNTPPTQDQPKGVSSGERWDSREVEWPATESAAKASAQAIEPDRYADKVLAVNKSIERQEELRLERERLRANKRDATTEAGILERELVGRSMDELQLRAIDWLWTGWIPRKYITLVVGESGAGKSTVLADIVARVTTGRPWPGEVEVRAPGRVLWLGSEDGTEDMTAPRLVACGANLKRVIEIQGVAQPLTKQRGTFSMQDDLLSVKKWLTFAEQQRDPFVLLVIDPVTSYLPGNKNRKVDLNDAGQLRSILEPWFDVIQEHNLAMASVTHFNKDASRSMLHRVNGSAAFGQTCRSLCAMASREDDGPFEKAMVQVKMNLPDHPGGAWRFRTEKVTVGTDPTNHRPITATRPVWEQLDVAITPGSFMGGERGPMSKTPEVFGMWVRSHFTQYDPKQQGLSCESVLDAATFQKVCSKRWWNDHSQEYLDKQNIGGVFMCWPKRL